MAPGTSGAEDLPKVRHKWSENSKVYTRKIHRNPKNNNSVTPVLNNQSVDKNEGETSKRIVVESNGGEPKHVVNGAVSSNNVEEVLGSVVEEAPKIKEVSERVDDKDVGTNRESVLEEVPDNGDVIEEMPVNDKSIKEVSENENNTVNVMEEAHVGGKSVGVAPLEDNNVEERPLEENNVEEGPHDVNHVEEDCGNDIDIEEEDVPERSLSPKSPIQEVNLSEPLENQSCNDTVRMSEGLSSHNRVEEAVPSGLDGNLANGVVREERPMVTQVEDRLNISVTAAKSKEEVRDLKRKLEDELDQVRKMARKLEAKETQLSNIGFNGGRFHETPVVGRLHIPVNGGTRNGISSMGGTSELGSVSYSHPRPFGELSVTVTNNSHHGYSEIHHGKDKRTPKANQYYRNSDFLLGKEKLPPADSHRKAKSSGGGRRHGGGEFDTGVGFDKKYVKKCSELLQKLRKHKHGWVFNQPVDVNRLGLHDYFEIIKHPMDLGTVKSRLTSNWYKTPREFAEDVRLTFHNAMTYNPEGQDVHIMAKELLRIFEDKWPAIDADYDRRLRYEMFRDLGTPTPTSRKSFAPSHVPTHMPLPPPPLLHPPPFHDARNLERSKSMPVRPEPRPKPTPSVRKPALKKPKAKDANKRDMTFDEKQKLSTNLQCLPSEKLDVIVQIIKKRSSALSQHDDEIEVDIDSVDTETLWELDRFVTNYKKSLSKHKRRAELKAAQAASQAATQAVPETVPPAPTNVEAPREENAGEGNVTISPHVQQEKHNDNASNSSSSSSSSSDSGSSSSDSDSSSSSDSDSDEDN